MRCMRTQTITACALALFAWANACAQEEEHVAPEAQVAPQAQEEDVLVEQSRKWLSLHAFADIETAYVSRGYVWDSRPFSAQYADIEFDLGDYGTLDGYAWSMTALSSRGHSTSMRYAYNEIDYGIRYVYDLELAEDWILASGVCRQWVTNPGVRHGGHSLLDWQAFQRLKNPYLTPYWKMRYIRHPYQATYWCVGAMKSFDIAENLSFTVDFFGDMGNASHFRHLFGPKPHHPESNYHSGIHALNLVLRLDWQATEHIGFYIFAAQYSLVSSDAREAIRAADQKESKCDITYGGIGVKFDF